MYDFGDVFGGCVGVEMQNNIVESDLDFVFNLCFVGVGCCYFFLYIMSGVKIGFCILLLVGRISVLFFVICC